MNKKFVLIGCAATALSIGLGIAGQKTNEPMESLMMENVEALAANEAYVPVHCFGIGCIDCPLNNVKVAAVYSGRSLLGE